jgi:protein-tyrosine phosphatase
MAEAIFKDKVQKAGLEGKLSADSCGTSKYHIGQQPDQRTLKVLTNHGISFRHAGRQLSVEDGVEFTYILAMDHSNYEEIQYKITSKTCIIELMRKHDPMFPNTDVPDPYHGDLDDFEEVYQLLDRSTDTFLAELKMNHNL